MPRIAILLVTCLLFCSGGFAEDPQKKHELPRVLVVAAPIKDLEPDHYLWAAEMTALRLPGNNQALPGGLLAALREAKEKPGSVQGILEVVVDVYTWQEDVRINCFSDKGKLLWKKNTKMNAGGSEERLARKMLERTLGKAEKQPACGG